MPRTKDLIYQQNETFLNLEVEYALQAMPIIGQVCFVLVITGQRQAIIWSNVRILLIEP